MEKEELEALLKRADKELLKIKDNIKKYDRAIKHPTTGKKIKFRIVPESELRSQKLDKSD